jgi:hypothetical protein
MRLASDRGAVPPGCVKTVEVPEVVLLLNGVGTSTNCLTSVAVIRRLTENPRKRYSSDVPKSFRNSARLVRRQFRGLKIAKRAGTPDALNSPEPIDLSRRPP